ncbi:MAG: Rad52/Rad22 family DNA repair protein, partial [Vibrio gallaecicus]
MEGKITIWEKLAVPFPASKIRWRIGNKTKKKDKATALAYIDARDMMERLDAVCGVSGWKDEYITEPPRMIRKTKKGWNGNPDEHWNEQICGRVICKLSIRDPETGEWITKSDGAGETNVEGEKGGISDAFKRAGVKFGINRECYGIKTTYLPIDEWGKFTTQP